MVTLIILTFTSFPPASYVWALWTRLFLASITAPCYYVQALLPRSLYVRLTRKAITNQFLSGRFQANALRKKPGLRMHRRKTLPGM